jgi:hypothetical protein
MAILAAMRYLVLSMLLLSVAPVCVAKEEPMIAIFGIGSLRCLDVLQEMEANKLAGQIYGVWLQGYIAGRNEERISRGEDARAGFQTTMDTLIAVLKIRCQKNPFAPLFGAAAATYQLILPGPHGAALEIQRRSNRAGTPPYSNQTP